MSDLDNYETISGRKLAPKLRPIDERAVGASGLNEFYEIFSNKELKRIVEKNEIERLD